MEHHSAVLLRRLNPYCARALEGAASLCQTRAHAEITPEHWLLKLLEQGEGDLTVLSRRYEWDMDAVWQSLLSWLDAQPRSVRTRPELSASLQTLLKQAWLAATLAGDEQIRSIHLLTAMVETSGLTRCDGLWPLMTLTTSQMERLRPLLEAQSDERHDVALSEKPCNVSIIGRAAPLQHEAQHQAEGGSAQPAVSQEESVLNRFTVDVTARAREGKIDPVFGRDNEIRQMVDILSRRRKNNPILVGEPGVGKTALVEGLALRIAEGNVPESLKPVIVRTLDLGLLQAGAGVKGEFEQRLKNIIDAVQHSPVPALARGELRTIAATTWSEYKQYFERDAALERRFQMVKVDEPDDDTACLMLRGLKSRYAEHHGVHITGDAVRAAVTLSRRYLTGRQLPDKAVDLLDTAAAVSGSAGSGTENIAAESPECGTARKIAARFVPFAKRKAWEITVDCTDIVTTPQLYETVKMQIAKRALEEQTEPADSQDMIRVVLTGAKQSQAAYDMDYIKKYLEQEYYLVRLKDETASVREESGFEAYLEKYIMDSDETEDMKQEILACVKAALSQN